jgi:hypothetical protein
MHVESHTIYTLFEHLRSSARHSSASAQFCRIGEHIRAKPPEERLFIRQEKAAPLLDEWRGGSRRRFSLHRRNRTYRSDPAFVGRTVCADLLRQ